MYIIHVHYPCTYYLPKAKGVKPQTRYQCPMERPGLYNSTCPRHVFTELIATRRQRGVTLFWLKKLSQQQCFIGFKTGVLGPAKTRVASFFKLIRINDQFLFVVDVVISKTLPCYIGGRKFERIFMTCM